MKQEHCEAQRKATSITGFKNATYEWKAESSVLSYPKELKARNFKKKETEESSLSERSLSRRSGAVDYGTAKLRTSTALARVGTTALEVTSLKTH